MWHIFFLKTHSKLSSDRTKGYKCLLMLFLNYCIQSLILTPSFNIQIHIINTEYHYLPNIMYEIKGNNTCLLDMLIYWSY